MDMESLMAQAQALQARVADAQEKLAHSLVKGVASDGTCIVDMTGKYDLVKLTIRPEALALGADALSESVASAYRDAKAKADKLIDTVMGDATGGVQMPF